MKLDYKSLELQLYDHTWVQEKSLADAPEKWFSLKLSKTHEKHPRKWSIPSKVADCVLGNSMKMRSSTDPLLGGCSDNAYSKNLNYSLNRTLTIT